MTETANLIRAAKNGSEAAYEELIKSNSPLVWSIVRRFLGRGADADDLYQLGCLGLLKAIRGFDETLGNQFSTYAVPKISGEIRRFLRDDGVIKVSRTLKERSNKIKYVAESLSVELGRAPTVSEISDATDFSPEEIAQAEIATSQTDSLNRVINQDGQTLEELLGDSGIEDSTLEYISLSQAIETLNQKERIVIMLRFFKALTQQQTAKIMKISQVQVSRKEKRILGEIKLKMVG